MDKEVPIYEILMLEKPITFDEKGYPQYGNVETVGFYYEEAIALKAIRQNWCDINEQGSYSAALVQKKLPGLYPITQKRWYFVFDYDNMIYVDKPIPKEMQHFNL